jgi:hypothetical protein
MTLHMPNLKEPIGENVIKLYSVYIGIPTPRHEIEEKQNRGILPGHEWYRCVEEIDKKTKAPSWRKGIGSGNCKTQSGQQMHHIVAVREEKSVVVRGPPVESGRKVVWGSYGRFFTSFGLRETWQIFIRASSHDSSHLASIQTPSCPAHSQGTGQSQSQPLSDPQRHS